MSELLDFRLVHSILHALRGRSSNSLHKQTGLAHTTISKIRRGPKYGGTRRPQLATVMLLAKAAHMELVAVETQVAEKMFVVIKSEISEVASEQAAEAKVRARKAIKYRKNPSNVVQLHARA